MDLLLGLESINQRIVSFFDETNCKLGQVDDGHVGGEERLCVAGTNPLVKAGMGDSKFTAIPITDFNGDPVMFVIIFQGEKVSAVNRMGIDVRAQQVGQRQDGVVFYEKNYDGEGKLCPGGPKIMYKGVVVDTMCFATPSGGVNAEIIKSILQRLDSLGLTERGGGVMPLLLVDGDGSRFKYSLLEYMTQTGTEWQGSLGLPNGSNKWEPGDDKRMNGKFKINWFREKELLVQYKERVLGDKYAIVPSNVVPLINRVWPRSFRQRDNNFKALCARGINPPNCALLMDKDIVATKPVNNDEIQEIPPDSVLKGVPTYMMNLDDLEFSKGVIASSLNQIERQ